MRKPLFDEEQIEYFKEIHEGRYADEIAELMNKRFGTEFTSVQIGRYRQNHMYYKNKRRQKKSIFSEEIEKFIKNNYKGRLNKELAEMVEKKFGIECPLHKLKRFKRIHGYDSGLTGHFEKGKPSLKKGKKLSPEVYEKCKATMFKKGNKSHNEQPIGTIMKNADGYYFIKVDDKPFANRENWMALHRKVWIDAHGEIPEGHIVIFLDGDRGNVNIENLACISKKEMMTINRFQLIFDDPELTKTGIACAKLYEKYNEYNRRNKQ